MDDDVLKILKMIEDSKITAAQGAELIEALKANKGERGGKEAAGREVPEKKKPKCFKIDVCEGDEKTVKVRIPLGLASCIPKFIPKGVIGKIKTGDSEFDLSEFLNNLDDCGCGEILTVDTDDGKVVKIYCE